MMKLYFKVTFAISQEFIPKVFLFTLSELALCDVYPCAPGVTSTRVLLCTSYSYHAHNI